MTAKNEHTGAPIKTGVQTDSYATGWERIFGRQATPVATPSKESLLEAVRKPEGHS